MKKHGRINCTFEDSRPAFPSFMRCTQRGCLIKSDFVEKAHPE